MFVANLKKWARRLKLEAVAVWLAARHPATPWHARLLGLAVVAYAFSPVDLIPDFIPVLGYLDDLLLVPAGLALCIWLIPQAVMAECRQKAAELAERPAPPGRRVAALVIVFLWVGLAAAAAVWLWPRSE